MACREQDGRFVPEQAVYRVTLVVPGNPGGARPPVLRGTVVINADSESLAARAARHGLSLLWREAGL